MQRLAQWCHDRHRLVIAIWIGAIVGFGVLAGASGGAFKDNFSLPGSESQKAVDLLQSKFPKQAGDSSQVVFKANDGTLSDAAHKAEIQALVTKLGTLPSVAGVQGPSAEQGSISKDGTIGFATLGVRQAGERSREGRRRARHRHREGRGQ